jgi:hypothetical protein
MTYVSLFYNHQNYSYVVEIDFREWYQVWNEGLSSKTSLIRILEIG